MIILSFNKKQKKITCVLCSTHVWPTFPNVRFLQHNNLKKWRIYIYHCQYIYQFKVNHDILIFTHTFFVQVVSKCMTCNILFSKTSYSLTYNSFNQIKSTSTRLLYSLGFSLSTLFATHTFPQLYLGKKKWP